MRIGNWALIRPDLTNAQFLILIRMEPAHSSSVNSIGVRPGLGRTRCWRRSCSHHRWGRWLSVVLAYSDFMPHRHIRFQVRIAASICQNAILHDIADGIEMALSKLPAPLGPVA